MVRIENGIEFIIATIPATSITASVMTAMNGTDLPAFRKR